MTKQEAIELLTEMQHNCYKNTSTDPKRFMKGGALDIAIECIEKCNKNCVNCASFDAEYNECDYWGCFIINGEFCGCDKWESEDNEL